MLTDNLSLALGVQKGRGSSPNINATCRELCALSLYANIRLHVRWIPSEHNPADAPSRWGEGRRLQTKKDAAKNARLG